MLGSYGRNVMENESSSVQSAAHFPPCGIEDLLNHRRYTGSKNGLPIALAEVHHSWRGSVQKCACKTIGFASLTPVRPGFRGQSRLHRMGSSGGVTAVFFRRLCSRKE
jgi:hypothetical protein